MQTNTEAFLIAGELLTIPRWLKAVNCTIQEFEKSYLVTEAENQARVLRLEERIHCFGPMIDPHVTLLNVLASPFGNGPYSFKNYLLMNLGFPICYSFVDSEIRIINLKRLLETYIHEIFPNRFIKVIRSRELYEQKKVFVYIDRYKLTTIAMEEPLLLRPQEWLAYDPQVIPELLRLQQSSMQLFRVINTNPKLATHLLNSTFGIWVYTKEGEKNWRDKLTDFVKCLFRENITFPGSNLYILTRDYWNKLAADLPLFCNEKDRILIQQHMLLFNPPEDEWIFYPEPVVGLLQKAESTHTHAGLRHCLQVLLLNRKPFSFYNLPKTNKNLLYQKLVMGKFCTLAHQLEPENTLNAEVSGAPHGEAYVGYHMDWYGYTYMNNWVAGNYWFGLKEHPKEKHVKLTLHKNDLGFYANHLDVAVIKGDLATFRLIIQYFQTYLQENPLLKKNVYELTDHFLKKAAEYEQHPMVWLLSRSTCMPLPVATIVKNLCNNSATCKAGIILAYEQFMVDYGYLYKITTRASLPKEMRATIFGFFKAAQERQTEKNFTESNTLRLC